MNATKQKFIIALLVTSLILFVGLLSTQNRKHTLNSKAAELMIEELTPTPTVFVPGSLQIETMDSPDGSATFTMESQDFETHVRSWFFHTRAEDQQKKLIFSEDRPLLQQLSIPFNAWSPDNKYVFLKRTEPKAKGYIVFAMSGEPFNNDARYLEIDELFASKVQDYTITDITGWAAPNLLLVNTIADEDGTQVSFWFDVPSQSFIRLSTYFR